MTKALAELRALIEQWTSFGMKLMELESSLSAVEQVALAFNVPNTLDDAEEWHQRPRFIETAMQKLVGRRLTLKEFAALQPQVKDDVDFAATWIDLAQLILQLRDVHRRLGKIALSDDERSRLNAAGNTLHAATLELWRAKHLAELATDKTREDVRDAQQTLYELAAKLPAEPLEAQEVLAQQLAFFPGATRTLGMSPSRPAVPTEADYVRLAKEYAKRLGRWDWLATGVAFAIAVFAGLTALYFGKSWGTPTDYVTAFLWGLTTGGGTCDAGGGFDKARRAVPGPRRESLAALG